MGDSHKIPVINQEFENNIRATCLHSRNDKYFSDVTLACEGKQIQSHKLVLSANSHVFKDLLMQIPCEHPNPLLYLRGITFSDLVSMLDYMYFGEITVDEHNFNDFIAIFKDFEIIGFESSVGKMSSLNDKSQAVDEYSLTDEMKDELELQRDNQVQNLNSNKDTRINEESITFLQPSINPESGNFVMENRDNSQVITTKMKDESLYKVISSDLQDQDMGVQNYENLEEVTMDSINVIQEKSKNITTKNMNTRKQLCCDQCEYKTSRNTLLQLHKQSKHEGIRYSCTKCDFKSIRKANLNEHILSKHEGICYPCDECDYKGDRKGYLRTHKRAFHEGIRFPCNQCNYSGALNSDLNKHILKMHDSSRYSCELCTHKTETRRKLFAHIKSEHGGIKHFCTKCEFKAKLKRGLDDHILSKHEGIGYPCIDCDYKANSKPSLSVHRQKWHTLSSQDSALYSCEFCTYKVGGQRNLIIHVNSEHKHKK